MRSLWLMVLVMMTIGDVAQAADKEPVIPMIDVELNAYDKLPSGKAALYEGEADADGVAFNIKGLSILTPVAVALEARDPAQPMTLELKNDFTLKWDRTVKTTSKGAVLTRFRTEGTAIMRVKSSGGRQAYRLVIWVGPELKIHKLLPPPFAKGKGASSGGVSIIGVVIAIAAVGLLVLVVVVKLRGRKRRPS
jgi:hypothetical protein